MPEEWEKYKYSKPDRKMGFAINLFENGLMNATQL